MKKGLVELDVEVVKLFEFLASLAHNTGAIIGGRFLFGYFVIEVITSWVTLGALVGALIAGGLADNLGRRQTEDRFHRSSHSPQAEKVA